MAENDEEEERPLSAFERLTQFVVRNVLPIILLPAITVSITGIVAWNNVERDLKDVQKWQDDHSAYHVERLRETKEEAGSMKAQLEASRDRDIQLQQRLDALAFQTSSNTKSIEIVETNQDKLNQSLQQLNTKLEVAVEILSRLDKAQRLGN